MVTRLERWDRNGCKLEARAAIDIGDEMSAYIIVYRETPVTNPEAIAEYSRRNQENAASSQADFGIRPLVVYGKAEGLEGATPDGVVMLKFPTIEAARGWYESEAYQAAIPFRQKAAEWRVVLVEGII